jgi:hypothetical protein
MNSLYTNGLVVIGVIACFLPQAKGHIYGEHDPIELTEDEAQGVVGALTIMLFLLMATEITGPEVLFLIALMIVTLLQIISLSDALSGENNHYSCNNPNADMIFALLLQVSPMNP